METRIYKLETGGVKGVVLATVLVGVGALIIAFGLALLLALATAGAVIGAGVVLFRRLTGRSVLGLGRPRAETGLDPSLEVFSENAVIDDRSRHVRPESLPPA
jgi:hypothetical protein